MSEIAKNDDKLSEIERTYYEVWYRKIARKFSSCLWDYIEDAVLATDPAAAKDFLCYLSGFRYRDDNEAEKAIEDIKKRRGEKWKADKNCQQAAIVPKFPKKLAEKIAPKDESLSGFANTIDRGDGKQLLQDGRCRERYENFFDACLKAAKSGGKTDSEAVRLILDKCGTIDSLVMPFKCIEFLPERFWPCLQVNGGPDVKRNWRNAQNKAKDCVECRNSLSHQDGEEEDGPQTPAGALSNERTLSGPLTRSTALRGLKSPKAAAGCFPLNTDSEAYKLAEEHLGEAVRKLGSRPLTLSELQEKEGIREKAALIPIICRESYDKEKGILYLHELGELYEELERAEQGFRSVFKLDDEKQTEGSASDSGTGAPVSAADLASGPLASLAAYGGGYLSDLQMDELLRRCVILPDMSFWMYPSGRDYLYKAGNMLQETCGKKIVFPYYGLAEMEQMEKRGDREAHNALKQISGMRHKGQIKYFPGQRAPLLNEISSQEAILRIVRANPEKRFCIFSRDPGFCRALAEEYGANALPVFMAPLNRGFRIMTELLPQVRACIDGPAPRQTAMPEKPAEGPAPEKPEGVKNAPAPGPVPQSGSPRPADKPPRPAPAGKKPLEKNSAGCYIDDGRPIPARIPIESGQVYTASGETLRLVRKLAEGGEGIIYQTDREGKAAKIYKKERLTVFRWEKLRYMTENDPHIQQLCWPEQLLLDENKHFVGFLMPLVPDRFLLFRRTVLALGKEAVAKGRMKLWDRAAMARLCQAICSIFVNLHRQGIFMGDVNENNIFVDPDDGGFMKLYFVDCDSFQIGDFPCPVGRKEYTSPGIYERLQTSNPVFSSFLRTEEDEDFALATLFFRILMLDELPYASKGGEDSETKKLRRQFSFRSKDSDGNLLSSGADAPVGPSRYVWSNMPDYLKSAFVEVFSRGRDVKLEEWRKHFENYYRDIRSGRSCNEIAPKKYYDPQHKWTVDFNCTLCGEESNMHKERYERLKTSNAPCLCDSCLSYKAVLEKEFTELTCSRCRKPYQENKFRASLVAVGFYRAPLCSACRGGRQGGPQPRRGNGR